MTTSLYRSQNPHPSLMNKIDSTLIIEVTKLANNFAYAHKLTDKEEVLSYFLEKTAVVMNKYDPDKGDFFWYLRKCLKFYGYNYLRDKSRSVKIPRSYSELTQKYKTALKNNPHLTRGEFSESSGIALPRLEKALEATGMKFVELKDYHKSDKPTGYKSLCLDYIRSLPPDEVSMLEDIFLDGKKPSTVFEHYNVSNEQGLEILNKHVSALETLRP